MRILIVFLFTIFSSVCIASDAEIIKVKAELTPAQKYNISVTVEHADEGWEHYANAWRIYSADGKLIGLPYYVGCELFQYNAEMLEKIGAKPPETWEELTEQMRTLNHVPFFSPIRRKWVV